MIRSNLKSGFLITFFYFDFSFFDFRGIALCFGIPQKQMLGSKGAHAILAMNAISTTKQCIVKSIDPRIPPTGA